MTDKEKHEMCILLVEFALWLSPVWDKENEDDIDAANEAVKAFLRGEDGP